MKALLLPALLLGGCAMNENAPPALDTAGACRADAATELVGQTPTQEVGAKALALTGARSIRWVLPNQAVTMDYRPDRLTVSIDAGYRIERLSCG